MSIEDSKEESAKQAVLDEAAKVNEERMTAVEELAAGVSYRIQLEGQLIEAEKEEKRLTQAAEKAGWTAAQVKRFIRSAKASPKRRKSPATEHSVSTNETVQGEV